MPQNEFGDRLKDGTEVMVLFYGDLEEGLEIHVYREDDDYTPENDISESLSDHDYFRLLNEAEVIERATNGGGDEDYDDDDDDEDDED